MTYCIYKFVSIIPHYLAASTVFRQSAGEVHIFSSVSGCVGGIRPRNVEEKFYKHIDNTVESQRRAFAGERGGRMDFWQWDDKYLTNVRVMDEDHQKLVTLFNRLYHRVLECEDMHAENALTREALLELMAYGRSHFEREEDLMRQYEYPDYQEHREAHDGFRARIAELSGQYERGEVALSFPLFVFLKEWIEEHVLRLDQRYGAFLNGKGVR